MDYLLYHLSHQSLPPRQQALSLLDDDERKEYARRGEPYLLVRYLLRRELSRRTGKEARELHLKRTPTGKPFLEEGLPFNLSHSGDYLCLAFHHRDIGVDIEAIRPSRVRTRLAARFMHPEQLEAFLSRESPPEEFFACWCAMEALVKQAAATIWQAQDFPFLYEKGRIVPLFPHAPRVELFKPAPGYCGAVAFHP